MIQQQTSIVTVEGLTSMGMEMRKAVGIAAAPFGV
jgi:hypothetical protein